VNALRLLFSRERGPSRIGFGTAPLEGWSDSVGEADADEALATALAAGITFFDTAPLYGYGVVERRLGRALQGLDRDSFYVSTKVGRLIRDGTWVPDFSYDGAMRSVDESLERMAIDRVDIVYVHDPIEPLGEAIDGAFSALRDLRDQGVVSAIGVGTADLAVLQTFIEQLPIDCVLLPGRYTLLDRSALDQVLPQCLERGVSVVIGGVYNNGILANPSTEPYFDYRVASDGIRRKAAELEAICARYGVPLAAAALQFPWSHPAVEAVLVGCRSKHDVDATLKLLEVSTPRELWRDLEVNDVPRAGHTLQPVFTPNVGASHEVR
jgi:D-threo-aldose 1-dehydrogenase